MRRQTIGTTIKPQITVNDVSVGTLPNKKYIECEVPAGKVTVSVNFVLNLMGKKDELNIMVESGKSYYIKTGVSTTLLGSVDIKRLNDIEGENTLRKCKQENFIDISSMLIAQTAEKTNPEVVSYDNSHLPQQEMITSVIPNSRPGNTSDVDIDVPETENIGSNKNTFVLILANEEYSFVDNVQYALNDGRKFKEYCVKTLGIPERQIWLYENASLGIISSGVNKMVQAMNIFDDARAIIYYCGHGIPDEKTGQAYIIPVDGNGTDISSCYGLNKLYQTMAEVDAVNVTFFMDACFTGAKRDGSMIVAARGVAREPKKETIKGNMVVFSAASGDETAMPFNEKGHGLFTYFLLKKLQETKGNVTYGELAQYISDNVKREAFLANDKPQNPVVATSDKNADSWKKIKIK